MLHTFSTSCTSGKLLFCMCLMLCAVRCQQRCILVASVCLTSSFRKDHSWFRCNCHGITVVPGWRCALTSAPVKDNVSHRRGLFQVRTVTRLLQVPQRRVRQHPGELLSV